MKAVKGRKWVLGILTAISVMMSAGFASAQQEDNAENHQLASESTTQYVGKKLSLEEQGAAKETATTDGSYVYYYSAWLSPQQFSSAARNYYWAGEQVCVNHRNRVLYDTATFSSIYGLYGPVYSSDRIFNNRQSPGIGLYSWCLDIPLNKAERGTATFALRMYRNEQGSALSVNLPFRVLRYGYVNTNRRYMTPMSTATSTNIYYSMYSAYKSLLYSTLKYYPVWRSYSYSAYYLLNDLKLYKPAAAVIHSHGSSAYGGLIELYNHSYVYADAETGNLAMYPALYAGRSAPEVSVPGGLFYAAVCEGVLENPADSLLGQAFIKAGYDAYIGYTASVYTDRNADFYEHFFAEAVKPNVSVSTALASTIAWANGQNWDDVATAKIIGDGSNLYLGGQYSTGSVLAAAEKTSEATESPNTVLRHWTKIDSIQLNAAEKAAVDTALASKDMRDALKNASLSSKNASPSDASSSKVETGLEEFRSVYRISVKSNGKFVRGVDIDKVTGKIVAQGEMD